MQVRALGILEARYHVLLERSKRRQLTTGERREITEIEAAVSELRSLVAVT